MFTACCRQAQRYDSLNGGNQRMAYEPLVEEESTWLRGRR